MWRFMRYLVFCAALGLMAAAAVFVKFPTKLRSLSQIELPVTRLEPPPQPDAQTYETLVNELARWRTKLAKRYETARTDAERDQALADARIILEMTLPSMMRCWLGTPWDFHGTARLPGQGKVACGYFVSTVLLDAGFQVDRYQLAQQASEIILRTFLKKGQCQLTIGRAYDAFADELSHAEKGIYLVGLDTHVGFAVVEENTFRLIHSSGSRPWRVVDESREEAEVLKRSNWRMLGNLTAHPEVVKTWLAGKDWSVARQ